jgi:hypothetical protein
LKNKLNKKAHFHQAINNKAKIIPKQAKTIIIKITHKIKV